MTELNVSNFNIAFFQPPGKPLPDERFADVLSQVLRHFPLPDQVSNPILIARRKEGGEINMTPIYIQFLNYVTKDFDSDLKIIREITDIYFSEYKTEKVQRIAIRFVSIVKATFRNGERLLIRDESFGLSPQKAKSLNPDGDVKIGVRLVFRRNDKRYDVKIEPYFKRVEQTNYIDFNVVRSELNVPPNNTYDFLNDELIYFKQGISQLIP